MHLKNLFADNKKEIWYPQRDDIFYPCWLKRTLILVVLVVVPQVTLYVSNFTPTHNRTVAETGVHYAVPFQILAILWIIVVENFKCIRIKCDKLWIELLPPRKDQERTQIYWRDVHQVREHLLPVIGRILMLRDQNGHWVGCIWISCWKNNQQLKNVIINAALSNGGFFISWKTLLLTTPKRLGKQGLRFLRWIKWKCQPR